MPDFMNWNLAFHLVTITDGESIMRKSTFPIAVNIFCLFCLFCFLTLPAHADAPNLISNGNFDQIKDNQADDWNFSSAKPEIFKLSFPQEKDHGNVAQMDVSSAVMSGYFNQAITVKPHTNYQFSALTQMNKGSILIFIHGGADKTKLDTRIYIQTLEDNPLVPWFWDKRWIEGSSGFPNRELGLIRNFVADPGKWEPVSIDFNSGELTSVTVSLGAYFKAGQYQFDDVSVTEIPVNK
jgi:hypothetical protein